ncbi:MAG: hypothetical protein KKC76_12130 [Proteobacteria bacterium]|nr:hypothetical protein [Pseudomonadota bacterium]MBU4295288.1 hypothetical protein [Pseudomonadota bacterium]MCG2748141.1 hypothetical protein [Desulfobulbaceae bacterium]
MKATFTKELIGREGTVPLVLKRMNGAANASTDPFVTASIDIIGVAAYFAVAKLFLES